jgi:hypothetical protein
LAVRVKKFLSPLNVQTGSGIHPALSLKDTKASSQVERSEREADLSISIKLGKEFIFKM